jgi:pimeloyl-ACP methyl ester carboxylesterase
VWATSDPRILLEGERFVDTSLGAIHVRISGKGPPIVLMHSNGHSWHEFEPMLDQLSVGHLVIAWDMPGHGDSDPVHPGTSIEQFAEALMEVLAQLDVKCAMVAGASVGAFIAACAAARHRDRVVAVALIELQYDWPDFFVQNWPAIERLFAIPVQTRDEVAVRHVAPLDDELYWRWNADRCRAGSSGMMGVMWAMRRFDVTAAIREIRCPTLVLTGAHGPTAKAQPRLAAALGAQAKAVLLPDAGHFISIDQPERFAAELIELAGRSEDSAPVIGSARG